MRVYVLNFVRLEGLCDDHGEEDIEPLSEFRADATRCIQHVNGTKRPLLITQHGRGAVVVVDVGEHERLIERLELVEGLEASEPDTRERRVTSHRNARADLGRRPGE